MSIQLWKLPKKWLAKIRVDFKKHEKKIKNPFKKSSSKKIKIILWKKEKKKVQNEKIQNNTFSEEKNDNFSHVSL